MNIHTINFTFFNKECSLNIQPLKSECFSILFTCESTSMYFFITSEKTEVDKIDAIKPIKVVYHDKGYAMGRIPKNRIRREIFTTDSDILISRLVDRSIRTQCPYLRKKVELSIIFVDGGKEKADLSTVAVLGANIAMKLYLGDSFDFNIPIKINITNNNIVICEKVKDIENTVGILFTINSLGMDMVEFNCKKPIDKDLVSQYVHRLYQSAKDEREKLANILKNINISNTYTSDSEIINLDYLDKLIEEGLNSIKHLIIHDDKKIIKKIKDSLETTVLKEHDAQTLPLAKNILANKVLCAYYNNTNKRLDGRSYDCLREISYTTKNFNKTHADVLFARGNTQVLTTMTIGYDDEKVLEDNCDPRSIYSHYTFYNFSCNEVTKSYGVKRRELGHGYIIEHALNSVLDKQILQNNTLRTCIDVLSSDGSTSIAGSMSAAICARMLGLRDTKLLIGVGYGGILNKDNKVDLIADITGSEDEFSLFDSKIILDEDKKISYIQIDSKNSIITPDLLDELMTKTIEKSQTYLTSIVENPELQKGLIIPHELINRKILFSVDPEVQKNIFMQNSLTKLEIMYKVKINVKGSKYNQTPGNKQKMRITVIGKTKNLEDITQYINTFIKT